jgi:hypothetical protein
VVSFLEVARATHRSPASGATIVEPMKPLR